MKPQWKKRLRYLSTILLGGIFVFILFETIRLRNTGFESKTLWNWMELLLIPLFLAGGAFYLERSERAVEREIAADRQREAALQTYFDRMAELLLKEKLRTTRKAEVRDVARTLTLSIMRVLDGNRKNLVIQFLREARLIVDKNSLLANANMGAMNLKWLDLNRVNLEGAKLMGAQLEHANLSEANLQGADLFDANLKSADLGRANLQGTHLSDANLQGAYLGRANLQQAVLRGDVNLRGSFLNDANLQDADIADEKLSVVESLSGATMPDGTKHE